MATRAKRRGVRKRGRRRVRRRPASRRSPATVALFAIALVLATVTVALLVRSWWLRPPHRVPLTMEQARAVNAAVPFVPGPVAPPEHFHFHGTPAAREQAIQCLATAALYEAGDDPRSQRAIIQVILNRVSQPGFPKTVCGVVYQGASLPTGCQFSFACDGSAARRPEHAGWEAARKLAARALGGATFPTVGTATHYHTDWVVPYWSGSLDKIAKVRSHIFYRRKQAGEDDAMNNP